MPTTCLNCATEFTGDFCPNCAQRASTRRFELKDLVSKNFLSETFNLDRGFLHTCLQMLYRPGHLVREYLAGQRKEYFNFIGFLLILLTVEAVLWEYAHNSVAAILLETMQQQLTKSNPETASMLTLQDIETVLRNQKLAFLLIVPLSAVGSWLIFRRTGFNYMENIVAVTFLLAMNTLLGLTVGLIGLLPLEPSVFKIFYYLVSVVVFGYGLVFFWQFSQPGRYTRGGRIWRTLVSYVVVLLVLSFSQQFFMSILAGARAAKEQPATEIVTPETER